MIAGLPEAKFGRGPCFARVLSAAEALSLDLAAFGPRSALVVGSNGKGTTAAMTAAALATGRKTGVFTSPHVLSIAERIVIDGKPIALAEMEALSLEVAAVASAERGGFEHLFLMAALAFARAGCEAVVWEAGIGGRLDPTRLVGAKVGALVSLDLEHTALLGDTLFAIGADKLDGFAPGAAVFAGPGIAPVWNDLAAYARASGKTLLPPPSTHADRNVLEAPFFETNARLALAIAERISGPGADMAKAIGATRLPCRLETVATSPPVIVDIAHTPDAAAHALEGFRRAVPCGGALILGVSKGKNAKAIAERLAPAFARIACVTAHHGGEAAERISALAGEANPEAATTVHASATEAMGVLRREGHPVLVTGSLYVAAEIKAAHLGLDPAKLWYF
jgi:dihydrofolate synthase/folylpolyglutamate synthase